MNKDEIRAELHCHSIYSVGEQILAEGLNSPKELIIHAKKLGLGCIALTDHDTMKGIKEAKRYAKKFEIFLIPGEEITTLRGHVVALGIEEEIPPKLSLEETLDKIRSQDGIAIAPHPFDIRRKGIREFAKLCDAIEVFNALNIDRFSNDKAKEFFDNKSKVAGSDAHTIDMLGYGVTIFKDCSNIDDFLKAIKKGKVKIDCRYIPTKIITDWSVQRIKCSYDWIISYMNRNYRFPKRKIGNQMIKLVRRAPGKRDYIFRIWAYTGLGIVFLYSFFRNRIF
ncbi:MAG: PHP domain-containing protein [Candidatus Aenigmatarchaeota archaeon]